jgi:mttA/Hcf106 family
MGCYRLAADCPVQSVSSWIRNPKARRAKPGFEAQAIAGTFIAPGGSMFGLSIWHILIIGFVLLVLFGGRISDVMGEAGRSIGSGDGRADRFVPPLLQRILKMFFR